MGQLGETGLGLAQLPDDELALGGFQRAGELEPARRGATRQAGDLRQVMGQSFGGGDRRWGLALRLQTFEKEHRIGEKSLPGLDTRRAPGSVQLGDLAAGEPVLGRGAGQAQTGLTIAAHQRYQVLHRRAGRDLAAAQQILDLGRQLVGQRQPARDPARTAAQTPRQLGGGVALAAQLRQQPALLERRLRRRRAQSARQKQRLAVAHRPHHGPHRVHAQPTQGTDPLVAVDDPVAPRLPRRDHHHRKLLAVLLQARE